MPSLKIAVSLLLLLPLLAVAQATRTSFGTLPDGSIVFPSKNCPAYATAVHRYCVGKGTFDSNGNVTLTAPVPPGTYYVFTSANGTKGALVWDFPITLKPGDNTITLTATNAELVQ